MERINKKIDTNRKVAAKHVSILTPARSNRAGLDDHAILEHLFGIINLEKQVSRALARCGTKVDKPAYALVAQLNTRVARFDRMLDESRACSAIAS